MVDYRPMQPDDLDGVIELCRLEGYPSFTKDASLTWRALTAPGVTTVVATQGGAVVGFAQMQSDGFIQAHLSNIVVAVEARGHSIGKRLVEEAFRRAGGSRVDLVSTEGSDAFYKSFAHRSYPGFRIYPEAADTSS